MPSASTSTPACGGSVHAWRSTPSSLAATPPRAATTPLRVLGLPVAFPLWICRGRDSTDPELPSDESGALSVGRQRANSVLSAMAPIPAMRAAGKDRMNLGFPRREGGNVLCHRRHLSTELRQQRKYLLQTSLIFDSDSALGPRVRCRHQECDIRLPRLMEF